MGTQFNIGSWTLGIYGFFSVVPNPGRGGGTGTPDVVMEEEEERRRRRRRRGVNQWTTYIYPFSYQVLVLPKLVEVEEV